MSYILSLTIRPDLISVLNKAGSKEEVGEIYNKTKFRIINLRTPNNTKTHVNVELIKNYFPALACPNSVISGSM